MKIVHSKKIYFLPFVLSLLNFVSCSAPKISVTTTVPSNPGIFVKKVENLRNDFIRGVDISSVIAEEKSGVVYKDAAGNAQDIFLTLKQNGVNYIRVRLWNNPFDKDGNSFGGGVCDLDTVIEIGKRATKVGMPLLVDYHYSDFWADPTKQQSPLAWKNMSVQKKSEELYKFTKTSLKKIISSGVYVGMVQIGNETTGAMCGETNWRNISKLMIEGSRAVRDVSKDILIAVHFTNPEKDGEYMRYAKILEHNKVDYDVFASSWYPFWHGTAKNLTKVLKEVAEYSGKRVMLAEFSYAYTYEDGDNSGNTISEDSAIDRPYPVSIQGQANCIRDTIDAVNEIGESAVGVFYWEPAWIPVPGNSKEERQVLWEKYGSGWASSFASSYDPNDAGIYYGGSSWDNQALFSFDGVPLPSLSVFGLSGTGAGTGATTAVKPDAAEEQEITVRLGSPVALPSVVNVLNNDGTKTILEVLWKATSDDGVLVQELSKHGVKDYKVRGSAGGVPVLARVSAIERNFVENPSFEKSDLSMWKIENKENITTELLVQDKKTDAKSGNKSLHFWSENKVDFTVSQKIKNLPNGNYKLSVVLHGGDAKNQNIYIFAETSANRYTQETDIEGWRNFREPVIKGISVTDGSVTIGASVSCDKGAWGSLDDFILAPEE